MTHATAAYAIELAPLALRPYAPIVVHVFEILGNLFATVVTQQYTLNVTEWGWRTPIAVEWAFPVPIICFLFFAPESPWWLVRKGRHDDALKALARLHNGQADDNEALV